MRSLAPTSASCSAAAETASSTTNARSSLATGKLENSGRGPRSGAAAMRRRGRSRRPPCVPADPRREHPRMQLAGVTDRRRRRATIAAHRPGCHGRTSRGCDLDRRRGSPRRARWTMSTASRPRRRPSRPVPAGDVRGRRQDEADMPRLVGQAASSAAISRRSGARRRRRSAHPARRPSGGRRGPVSTSATSAWPRPRLRPAALSRPDQKRRGHAGLFRRQRVLQQHLAATLVVGRPDRAGRSRPVRRTGTS